MNVALMEISKAKLEEGDITWTWCSRHIRRTLHIWNGYKLICIERGCHPELDPEAQEIEQESNQVSD